MTKKEFIKLVSKIDQTGEDEFKAIYNSPDKIYKVFTSLRYKAHRATALLEELSDLQNGVPLESYREEWESTIKQVYDFLEIYQK